MAYGETYEEFVDKFKPKLTTDDCMTPQNVYDIVADYVADRYGVDRSRFVRPFWPGEDYQARTYADGEIVVDNPPFSMLSKICRWYEKNGIPFFLFSNGLTSTNRWGLDFCIIYAATITYENGAVIPTTFTTNMETPGVVLDSNLLNKIDSLKPNKRKKKCTLLPQELNAARLICATKRGANMKLHPSAGSSKTTDGRTVYGCSVRFSDDDWERLKPFLTL